jgi:hypothetical protein
MESKVGPLGTSATSGIFYLLLVILRMDNLMEWRLAGDTEVLGESLPQHHFFTTDPTWPDLGAKPGRRSGKPATNRLSCGAT